MSGGDEDGGAATAWLSLKATGDDFHKSRDFGAAVGAYTAALDAALVLDSQHAVLYSNRSASNLELRRPHLALEDAGDAIRLGELQNMHLDWDWRFILSSSLTCECLLLRNYAHRSRLFSGLRTASPILFGFRLGN